MVKIIKEEDKEVGEVKLKVYISYFKYMEGTFFMMLIFLIILLWQINKGESDDWLAYWSKPENQEKTEKK